MNAIKFVALAILLTSYGAVSVAQAHEHPISTEHPTKAEHPAGGLLACHVVPGTIMVENMKTMKAANINGQDLNIQVSDDAVTCNNARVVQADLVAANGVIHAIDSVIILVQTEGKAASEKPKDHPAH